jgi:hypothetical protein
MIAELDCRATRLEWPVAMHRHEKHSATAGIVLDTPDIWSRRNAIVRLVTVVQKRRSRVRAREPGTDRSMG